MELHFCLPTDAYFGKDCVKARAAELKKLGGRALIVTGAHSAEACGALGDVTSTLSANGQDFAVFSAIASNPTIDSVYAGASAAREAGADFVIGIGGGSPMDASKAIALLAADDIPRDELFSVAYEKRLPLCCIPTTAGTGSEVTQYSVLTNDAAQSKTSMSSPLLFPDLALLDGKYLEKLPGRTMINTVIDSLSHSVESCLSVRANALTRILAAEAIGTIVPLFGSLRGWLDYASREKLLYASMLGGMVIAQTGTTAVHSMGYSLTYFKHIDHGRANGLLLAAYLRVVAQERPDLVSLILAAAKMSSIDDFRRALDDLLGEKETLTADEVEKFTDISVHAKNIANCAVRPTACEIAMIYKKSFGL